MGNQIIILELIRALHCCLDVSNGRGDCRIVNYEIAGKFTQIGIK
jgi:hypothetical protein